MSSVIWPLLGLYQHIIYIHFHSFSEQWPKHLGYQSLVGGPDILKILMALRCSRKAREGGGGGGGGGVGKLIKDVFFALGGYMGI